MLLLNGGWTQKRGCESGSHVKVKGVTCQPGCVFNPHFYYYTTLQPMLHSTVVVRVRTFFSVFAPTTPSAAFAAAIPH